MAPEVCGAIAFIFACRVVEGCFSIFPNAALSLLCIKMHNRSFLDAEVGRLSCGFVCSSREQLLGACVCCCCLSLKAAVQLASTSWGR